MGCVVKVQCSVVLCVVMCCVLSLSCMLCVCCIQLHMYCTLHCSVLFCAVSFSCCVSCCLVFRVNGEGWSGIISHMLIMSGMGGTN